MAAIGEIFRLTGGLCLMSSHLTSRAHLSLTLSNALLRHAVAASILWADGCAALAMAAWMACLDQGCPQSTGHPSVAHLRSIFAAGCCNTLLRGHINPCNVGGNLRWLGVRGSGLARFRRGGVARPGCSTLDCDEISGLLVGRFRLGVLSALLFRLIELLVGGQLGFCIKYACWRC